MALATWWSSDPLPALEPLPGLRVRPAAGDAVIAALNRLSLADVRARRQAGHQPYLGFIGGIPVAYGWLATRVASIGELNLTIQLPPGECYLWDFATRSAWQGRGIYPRLLQAILQQASRTARRFWIISAPENLPSCAGMRKAGFTPVAELSFDLQRNVRLAPSGALERARAAARLLGLPLVDDRLAPCWSCQRAAGATSACWPVSASSTKCSCAIQLVRSKQRDQAWEG